MNRINIDGFTNLNDVTVQNLTLRNKLNVFEYCGWRHEIEATQNVYTGTYEENLKSNISTPKGLFINGNIVLNDPSSISQSGSLTLKNIHLGLNDNKRSLYNILGVPKNIKKISISPTSALPLLGKYVYKDNVLIGEIIDVTNNDVWVECYYSSTQSVLDSNQLKYSDLNNGTNISNILSPVPDTTYVFDINNRTTYPPSFKEVNL